MWICKKNGVTNAARKYHTNRKFVYRQLEKYDGTVRSLALKSRKPHNHPNAHTEEELKRKIKRYNARYNNIAKKVLEFKSPNQIVEEYLCTQL